MSKQKTSFSLSADNLTKLAELAQYYNRSKASSIEELVAMAHLKMSGEKLRSQYYDKLLEKDENGFYKVGVSLGMGIRTLQIGAIKLEFADEREVVCRAGGWKEPEVIAFRAFGVDAQTGLAQSISTQVKYGASLAQIAAHAAKVGNLRP